MVQVAFAGEGEAGAVGGPVVAGGLYQSGGVGVRHLQLDGVERGAGVVDVVDEEVADGRGEEEADGAGPLDEVGVGVVAAEQAVGVHRLVLGDRVAEGVGVWRVRVCRVRVARISAAGM
ncbi:hypothetical protein ACFWB2_20910 [Streptomyces virginiae]|uniref:hypothetical protein n=1 Tax=Streptomyces virginiae TaxID=1961 RepID=UPI003691D36D